MLCFRLYLTEQVHGCLGCPVCHPPAALNALSTMAAGVPAAPIPCKGNALKIRSGWPPLAGDYTVFRHRAPVAICTLTDNDLSEQIAREAGLEVSIVGGLQTENLGIERLILNVLTNPNIRFLILCGADSRQSVGHLPGQSLLALAQNGVDENLRIVGAKGQRPQLLNLKPKAVSHLRNTVEVIDLIGNAELYDILDRSLTASLRNLQPAEPYEREDFVQPVKGYIPRHMTADPQGYVVIYVDRARDSLIAEHYSTEGLIDAVIEGHAAQELYFPLIERGLISRLDHAVYLGRELTQAEHALLRNEPYAQDSAPEASLLPDEPKH
jgi:tetrahydromethanopterin S-methyltransferase subunit A